MSPVGKSFFKSLEKQGGPIFPDICFHEVYNEMYSKQSGLKSKEDSEEEQTDRFEMTNERDTVMP